MDQNNIESSLLTGTTKYNEEHILFQTKQWIKNHQNLDAPFIIENVCYKENSIIPIIDESAKLKIARHLVEDFGKKVIIKDTEEIIQEVKKEYGILFDYEIKDVSPPSLMNYIHNKITLTSEKDVMKNVYNFWNERPCNIRHSNKEVGTKEYFEEVTKRKYIVEPHILTFAEFEKYKNKKVLEV